VKWSQHEKDIVYRLYRAGGPDACLPYLPQRTRAQIGAWAAKRHLHWRGKRQSPAPARDVTCSAAGAPGRYVPEWAPYQAPAQPLVRPGALNYRSVPSFAPQQSSRENGADSGNS